MGNVGGQPSPDRIGAPSPSGMALPDARGGTGAAPGEGRGPRSRLGSAWRRRVALLFGIVGPGLIAANADNDAGGITTNSIVGAHYGYQMLWALLLITFSLAVTQEIGARTGAVTGKGLAALIRERYGVRITALAMLGLLVANLGTTVAEFAGVAASLELFGIPRLVSVPLAAAGVWLLVIRGSYKSVERVFLVLSLVYISYLLSGFLVGPDWGQVARSMVTPTLRFEPDFLVTLVALIGTTITPWGQFFIQAYVVDKGVRAQDYAVTRLEVYAGAIITDVVSLFIVLSTAGTLFVRGIRIEDASQAALALGPLAGPLAQQLFGIGLLNASLLGAAVVPLATAYAVCEAFGWEAGVSRSFRDAPAFNGLYTFSIVAGALAVLLPGLPLFSVILLSQTVNGMLLPLILVFAARLAADRELLGAYASGPVRNLLTWATVAALTAVTAALLAATVVLPALGVGV